MTPFGNLWIFLLCFITLKVSSQVMPGGIVCPPNIGFETGSLNNWECFEGLVARDGTLNLSPTSPSVNRHSIIQNTFPQSLDPYGGFPINCPNGSGYSIRLGNSSAGGQAESVNYTFTIPANKNDYSILYHYAVVFQNPPHKPEEQPRFQSRVYNVTDNKYIDCGSFQYVASSNLPGFRLASTGNNVFYKPWSPVTVDLSGLAGKTVRLEFATNDCAFTQHFGYAYVDVNDDCSAGPIAGNTYCAGAQSVNLAAPFGFSTYSWYTGDFSQLLGTQNILTISPAPPPNTNYAVIVTPYEGVGCLDTLYTTIHLSPEPYKLNVLNEITGCPTGVDLTAPAITAGSTPGITYTYYTDLSQINYVPVPTRVTTSGIYYIKGVNRSGCNDIKPIQVTIMEPPRLTITNPEGVCIPQKIDITHPAITSGSEPSVQLSYWIDAEATIPLLTPNAINSSGTYFIMGIKSGTCGIVKPVEVKIGAVPKIVINNPTGCGKVNIAEFNITAGSDASLSYSYWADPAATILLTDENNITTTGTYYIKSSSPSGCSVTKPALVTVNPFPNFTVTDPKPAIYPVTSVDLTSSVDQNVGLSYTYWLDSLTRKTLSKPKFVDIRGRYFIKSTNEFGCSVIKGVNAVIIPPPEPMVYVPNAFTPNNDGLNDVFKIKIIGETAIHRLRIYNRWGQIVYDDPNLDHQWNGKLKGIELPAGVYVWIFQGLDTYFKKPFEHKGLITLLR
jgi:gliding motility-associated-like protein